MLFTKTKHEKQFLGIVDQSQRGELYELYQNLMVPKIKGPIFKEERYILKSDDHVWGVFKGLLNIDVKMS